MKRPDFYVSMSPHVHGGYSIPKMMYETILALVPVIFAAWFFFGMPALKVIFITGASAVAAEALWQLVVGRPVRAWDGSALLSGLLLGLLLSPDLPWWIPMLGGFTAVLVGKQLYGGLGQNPFNVALVGWAILRVSYGSSMGIFPMTDPQFMLEPNEFLEYPPIEILRFDGPDALMDVSYADLFIGNVPGAPGTVSVLAVLVGGAYLLYRRIVTWHVPVFFILSAWVFAFVYYNMDPDLYAHPNFHIMAGWIMLGAFFLAPEKGSSPVTVPGMILFGVACGALTVIIRIYGSYVEGVHFAILLANSLTPLLDRIRPRVIGRVKEIA